MKVCLPKSLGAIAGAAVSAFSVLLLSGCQTVTGSQPQTLVRVIDASPSAQAVDAYVETTPIAINIGPGSITPYAYLAPGAATTSIDPTGTHTTLAQASGTFLASQQHSIYLTSAANGTGYDATILTDQNTPAPSGSMSVRFLQQAQATGPVDVYFVPSGSKLSQSKPVLSGLAPGTVTQYIEIPAGTYNVEILPTGSSTTGTNTEVYVSSQLTYSGGEVRTMLIVDQQVLNNPAVNLIVGDDLN